MLFPVSELLDTTSPLFPPGKKPLLTTSKYDDAMLLMDQPWASEGGPWPPWILKY